MSAPISRTNMSKLAWLERTSISPVVIEQVTNLAWSLSSLLTTQSTRDLGWRQVGIKRLRAVGMRMKFTETDSAMSDGLCSTSKYLIPSLPIHFFPSLGT